MSERSSHHHHRTAHDERRRARRVILPAQIVIRWEWSGQLEQVKLVYFSASGFRFRTPNGVLNGEMGRAISIKPEGTPVDAEFVVVWSREYGLLGPHGQECGAQFIDPRAKRRDG